MFVHAYHKYCILFILCLQTLCLLTWPLDPPPPQPLDFLFGQLSPLVVFFDKQTGGIFTKLKCSFLAVQVSVFSLIDAKRQRDNKMFYKSQF